MTAASTTKTEDVGLDGRQYVVVAAGRCARWTSRPAPSSGKSVARFDPDSRSAVRWVFADCRQHIDRAPTEYLKDFYYDTVNFNPSAIRLALDFAGPDRILAGSDYPHQIGSIPLMIETIQKLDVTDEVRKKVLRGNAAALLGLG